MRRFVTAAIAATLLSGCQRAPGALLGFAFGLDAAPTGPAPTAIAPAAPASSTDSMTAPQTDAAAPLLAPAASDGGGGASGAGPVAPVQVSGLVRDDAEQPIAGALVRFLDGRTVTTDPDGRFTLAGAGGPLAVSAPGYVPSWVLAPGAGASLHLQRTARVSAPFEQREIHVHGSVDWGVAAHGPGLAYYVDTQGSVANPVPVTDGGTFDLSVLSVAGGSPEAAIFVLATDTAGDPLFGQTPAFAPFSGQPAPGVTLAPLTRGVAFAVSDRPTALSVVSSRVECRVPDGPVLTIEGPDAASGTVHVPVAPNGPLSLVVEARDADGDRRSDVRLPIGDAPLSGRFLAVPEIDAAAAGTVRWQASPGASGHRVSVSTFGAGLALEAWVTGAAEAVFGPEAWPTAGEVTVEAIDAPGLDTRAIARVGPRHLRLDPLDTAPTYRRASCKRTF